MIEKKKSCADADRFAERRAEPHAVIRADARAVVRAEMLQKKWQRCRNLCRNGCRTLADAESRADTCADADAESFADIRAVVRADVYAESGMRWDKYRRVYYYCVILIHFYTFKVQKGTNADSRAELFAEICAGAIKKSANAVYGADDRTKKWHRCRNLRGWKKQRIVISELRN